MDDAKEFICNDGKSALRRELAARRAALTDKPWRSRSACLTAAEHVRGSVMIYASIGSELSTETLIARLSMRSDVELFVPYTSDGEIEICKFISQGRADKLGNLPKECLAFTSDVKLDYCITPLLGFNERGYRIGYGKGCYDKFFRKHTECVKIGLAFDCQRCEFTPQPFDVPLDRCITETDVIYF